MVFIPSPAVRLSVVGGVAFHAGAPAAGAAVPLTTAHRTMPELGCPADGMGSSPVRVTVICWVVEEAGASRSTVGRVMSRTVSSCARGEIVPLLSLTHAKRTLVPWAADSWN